MVKAAVNTPDALLAALKAAHHYSTTGPELRNITFDAEGVTVENSAVCAVIVKGKENAVHGASMTRRKVPFDLVATSDWFRITVIDSAGKRAWSNL